MKRRNKKLKLKPENLNEIAKKVQKSKGMNELAYSQNDE
jgi:hypothetical protein